MRHFALLALAAVGAVVALAPRAHAREITELRERVRDAVQRADKDVGTYVHRDKLNDQQREKFDSAVTDLQALRDSITNGKWQSERERMVRATDNIEFLQKNAPLNDDNRNALGIDVFTMRTILDNWKP